ncbi:flagellar protein FlaG [Acidihalobacter ferrooxydans]|uniref:Flagellar biosynthesis protein FlaG n=1 Tax=Acidihalobacter ferrooxydans TaxID=1765967 RepID=A0A1P8UGN2_9GAMM|nr:flagellar protein FlaG [Acidihalobacter ferrooxydans]APZ42996.1 hypothetical protein BW247_07735 [Acidihalobacter ferrooxydans]
MNPITDIKGLSNLIGPVKATSHSSTSEARSSASGKILPVQGQGGAKVDRTAVGKAVVQVNNYLQQQSRTLEFSVDKTTGETVVKIIDQANGKVLRQIPPEYMLHLAQTLLEHNGVSSTGIKLKT